jgi:hypothetical protein
MVVVQHFVERIDPAGAQRAVWMQPQRVEPTEVERRLLRRAGAAT